MAKIAGGNYGALVSGQSLYDFTDAPTCAVGTRLPLGDRVFYYSKFSADIDAGVMASTDASIAGPILLADDKLGTMTKAQSQFSEIPIVDDPTVGQKVIAITDTTLASVTAGMLENGYIVLTDSGGVDQIYKIRKNGAYAGRKAQTVEIELYDDIRTAITGGTAGICISCSPFMNLKIIAVDSDEHPAGVPLVAVDYSEKPYGWVQTWGLAMVVLTGTSGLPGNNLILGAGTVIPATDGVLGTVGVATCAVTTTLDASLAYLRLHV